MQKRYGEIKMKKRTKKEMIKRILELELAQIMKEKELTKAELHKLFIEEKSK